MDWIKEHFKDIFLPALGLIFGWLTKKYNWLRLKPKEKVEVQSLEQTIDSKRLEDDLKRNAFTMDLLVVAEAKLNKANERITEEETKNMNLHKLIQGMNDEMDVMRTAFNKRVAKLEQMLQEGAAALNEERRHCSSIRQQLKEVRERLPENIKQQYGI